MLDANYFHIVNIVTMLSIQTIHTLFSEINEMQMTKLTHGLNEITRDLHILFWWKQTIPLSRNDDFLFLSRHNKRFLIKIENYLRKYIHTIFSKNKSNSWIERWTFFLNENRSFEFLSKYIIFYFLKIFHKHFFTFFIQ